MQTQIHKLRITGCRGGCSKPGRACLTQGIHIQSQQSPCWAHTMHALAALGPQTTSLRSQTIMLPSVFLVLRGAPHSTVHGRFSLLSTWSVPLMLELLNFWTVGGEALFLTIGRKYMLVSVVLFTKNWAFFWILNGLPCVR